jgi:hypothetical protein
MIRLSSETGCEPESFLNISDMFAHEAFLADGD